jgi:hypothetical protein
MLARSLPNHLGRFAWTYSRQINHHPPVPQPKECFGQVHFESGLDEERVGTIYEWSRERATTEEGRTNIETDVRPSVCVSNDGLICVMGKTKKKARTSACT